jgi:hypothetical protein
MRFVFRFRSVTAMLLLACIALNAIFLPKGVSWQSLASLPEAGAAPLVFGQAHNGVFAMSLALAFLLALVLLFMPIYSLMVSRAVFICVLLILLAAISFQFAMPAFWVLPLWASWRLSGRPGWPAKSK